MGPGHQGELLQDLSESLWDLEMRRGEWCRIWTPQAGSHQAFLKGGGRHGQSQPHPESSELRGLQTEDLYGDIAFMPAGAGEGGRPARVRGPCNAEDGKSSLVLLLLHQASWPSLRKGVQPLTVYGLNLDACSWLKDALCRLPAHSSRVYPPPAPSLIPCMPWKNWMSQYSPRTPRPCFSPLWSCSPTSHPPAGPKGFPLDLPGQTQPPLPVKAPHSLPTYTWFFHLYSMNLLRCAAYFSSLL